MTRIYEKRLAVSPFMISAVATGHESEIIFGPQTLARGRDKVVAVLHGFINENDVRSPVIGQVSKYKDKTIIATTIQTKAIDDKSKRDGLRLVYGAAICGEVFTNYSNVSSEVFSLFNECFREQYGVSLDVQGANKIVEGLTRKNCGIDDYLKQGDFFSLLSCFEKFGIEEESLLSTWAKILRGHTLDRPLRSTVASVLYPSKLMHTSLCHWRRISLKFRRAKLQGGRRYQTAANTKELSDYWNYVDSVLCAQDHNKPGYNPVARQNETVSIEIPKDLILKILIKLLSLNQSEQLPQCSSVDEAIRLYQAQVCSPEQAAVPAKVTREDSTQPQ